MDPSEKCIPRKRPRKCFVPKCNNNSQKNESMNFFLIPFSGKKEWCKSLGVYCPQRPLYICEEHLNLKEDLQNYFHWTTMKATPKLKSALPKSLVSLAKSRHQQQNPVVEPEPGTSLSSPITVTIDKETFYKKSKRCNKAVQLKRKTADITISSDKKDKRNVEDAFVDESMSNEGPSTQGSQKSGRRKQILNERSETTDCIAQIENYEPQHVLDDSTVMMIDQPEDSVTSAPEIYRLVHPLLELTCPEEMHPESETDEIYLDSETDDADEVIEQEVEEEEYKIDIEEHPVQEQPVSSLPDTRQVEVEEPLQQEQPSGTLDTPPEPTVLDTTDDCEQNEQVPLRVTQPFSERAETWLSNELYTIIVNVYRFLEQEYQQLKAQCCQKCDHSFLANVSRRTAIAVGVTQKSVAEALKVEKRNIISLDHNYHCVPQNNKCGTKRVYITKCKKPLKWQIRKPVKLKQKQPVAGTERVLRKRKRRTKDIVDETPVADTDGDYVLPKRKRRTKRIVEKTPVAGTERVLRKRKRRTRDFVDETSNSPSHLETTLRTEDTQPPKATAPPEATPSPETTPLREFTTSPETTPLREDTPSPEATETEFKIDIADNWPKALEEATPLREDTPSPEATETEFKIDIDDNWPKALEEATPLREDIPSPEDTPSPEATETEFKIDIDDNWPKALEAATPLREVTPSPKATETKFLREIDDNWQKALEEATPLREASPLPEATETKFIRDIDDNWQKAPEEDPFITESTAVVYEAPDGTQTALHGASEDTQDALGPDPLGTQPSDDLLVKPFTTLGVDVKIEPNNEGMEPYADYSVSDATPQDVKCEQLET